MAKVTLNVPDISCEHCQKTITETLAPQAGIKSVQVNIPAKQVYLEYDEHVIDLDKVSTLLNEEGYPVESVSH